MGEVKAKAEERLWSVITNLRSSGDFRKSGKLGTYKNLLRNQQNDRQILFQEGNCGG
jgi:hypothetical protein